MTDFATCAAGAWPSEMFWKYFRMASGTLAEISPKAVGVMACGCACSRSVSEKAPSARKTGRPSSRCASLGRASTQVWYSAVTVVSKVMELSVGWSHTPYWPSTAGMSGYALSSSDSP